jgi:hypothetical protein
MAVLSLLIVAGVAYSVVVAVLTSRTYFGVSSNKPFADNWPDIDPPLWRVALGHIAGLLSTVLWLLRWPSATEVWMALCLVPLLFVPFPLILNNMLEWVTYLIFGNARGDGSHRDYASGAPPLRWSTTVLSDLQHAASSVHHSITSWLRLMWRGRTWNEGTINYNHSLLCYLQSESWAQMHHLDPDILTHFPTAAPNSRVNAVMMARCATMSYDRWHNIDQAVSLRWNQALNQERPQKPSPTPTQQQKFSLVKAWSFDRVTKPSSLEKRPTGPSTTPTDKDTPKKPAAYQGKGDSSADQDRSWVLDSLRGVWDKIVEFLTSLQRRVKDVNEKLKIRAHKAVRLLVWYWAGVGPPGPNDPLFDPDEFTSINTDAFLIRANGQDPATGDAVVALVLAFRGTEALQTVDWISDLAQVAPPTDALNPRSFPQGFTHQGFRDSLGLKRNLEPADDLKDEVKDKKFTSSYLVYDPSRVAFAGSDGATSSRSASRGSTTGPLQRVTPAEDAPQEGPFTVITKDINEAIREIRAKHGGKITIQVFVTGHSLGGALAHLYTGALLLSLSAKSPAATCFEGCYTFGEPRVGGQIWVTRVEQALRNVKGPGGVAAEDRFKRVVNTLDIVTRIPPPLGEIYQHPGHCTFVKPHFAIARPALTGVIRAPAAAAPPPTEASDDNPGSSEMPDVDKRDKKDTAKSQAATKALEVKQSADKHLNGDHAPHQGPGGDNPPPVVHTAAAGPAAPANDRATDSSYSPTANLIETPDIFLGPTVLTVLLKLVLSVMLLFSAAVLQVVSALHGWKQTAAVLVAIGVVFWPISAAILAGITAALTLAIAIAVVGASISIFTFVFWPSKYEAIIAPVLKELDVSCRMLVKSLKQPVLERPRLLNNPMYLITRLVAFLGPAPIVLLLDLLLLPVITVLTPILGWTLFVEPILVGFLFVLMPPAIIGGLVDHSMAEYYTACWLTINADWETVSA